MKKVLLSILFVFITISANAQLMRTEELEK